jgi:dipeptidyl aminopeptidase/acylaminoacyl peptidase
MKRTLTSWVLMFLALSGSVVPAQDRAVSIEKLLSVALPSGLVASPSAGKLAWVQNAEGVRNIWVAGPPDYAGHVVTRYSKDDGRELSALTFTPDGKTVIYVRGGGPNTSGIIPNPTSDPIAQERAIWRVPSDGGEPSKISEGHSPTVSPDGSVLAFINHGQIFSASFNRGGDPAGPLLKIQGPGPLLKIQGGPSSLRWAPDGSRLAFVSHRGDHAFIGVYDVAAKTVRYLAPSVDQDSEPVWSPDSRRIAFIRVPWEPPGLFLGKRSGLPWSIMVADASTGVSTSVWHADAGPGSIFYAVVAENQLLWGAGDRLVFPWERDGWAHLYAIPASGGTATLLTPGAFEVECVTLSPDRRHIFYNSNQDDLDRRHLWRVPIAGGTPASITKGNGIEWMPAATSDGNAIAFFCSGARTPAHAVIRSGEGKERHLAPGSIPVGFPEDSLVEPQPVIISASDGVKIHGQLFLPANLRPGERRPALVFSHGGPTRQMLLGFHYIGGYHNAYALNQYFANQGFIVLSFNYRNGIGYGIEFRETPTGGAGGASEVNDLLGAGLYLKSRSDVDPRRIGLWGGSYGGYLTAQGLARAPELFAAGVDIYGVHEWNTEIKNWNPAYNPLAHPDEAKLAFESSPMAAISTWRGPVLFIHGDDDRNVPFNQTVILIRALRKQGVDVEQLIFPDEVHGMLVHSDQIKEFRAIVEFLERRLGRKASSQ